jgi:hypothetical protein
MKTSLFFIKAKFVWVCLIVGASALPGYASGAPQTHEECDAREKQLEETYKWLLSVCSLDTYSAKLSEYKKLKARVLSPELRKQVDAADALNDRMMLTYSKARKIKLDLIDEYVLGFDHVPAEFILYTRKVLESFTTVKDVRYSEQLDKAKVSLLRDVPVKDDPGKVWSPYKEDIDLFFLYQDGRWLLHEVAFQVRDKKKERGNFHFLTGLLTLKNQENRALAQTWERDLAAAMAARKRGSTHTKGGGR